MTNKDDTYHHIEDTNTGSVALESARITLDLYRSGKSGIPFNTLLTFTKPIVSHYQLDLPDVDIEHVTSGNLGQVTLLLDILETACMFWDYCCLDDAEKQHAFDDLQKNLLGPDPTSDDLVQFPLLLASMEECWIQFSHTNNPPAPQKLHINGSSAGMDFDEIRPSASEMLYGPDQLDVPEAFALFSRPMMEDPALFDDPDKLDDIMIRAEAYWDLAHMPSANQERQLQVILSKFYTEHLSKQVLIEEASQMLQRFHELFPERK